MKKILSLLALAPLTLAACGEEAVAEAPTISRSEGFYISNYNENKEVVSQLFTDVPEKVIAEGQGAVDLIVALGLGDKLVGTYQGTTKDMKDEWNFTLPTGINKDSVPHSQEEALSLDADFIIGTTTSSFTGGTRLEGTDYWHNMGVNTYIHESQVDYPSTIEKEYLDIMNVARIFDVMDKGFELINEIQGDVSSHQITGVPTDTNVLIYQDNSASNGYKHWGTNTYGESFLAEINDNFNIMGENQWGKNQVEHIVDMGNPDIIIIAASNTDDGTNDQAWIDATKAVEGFVDFNAVKNNNIFVINTSDLISPSVRAADAIGALSAELAKATYA